MYKGALFLLPYLLSLALGLTIVGYVRKYRGIEAARSFSYKVIAESLIIAGFLLETLSPSLIEKVLWDDVQYVLDLALPGLTYLFVLSITQREVRSPAAPFLVLVAPAVGAAFFATDSLHHLIRPTASLNLGPLFPELTYPITTVQDAMLGYILAFLLFNVGSLVAFSARAKGLIRRQSLVTAGALLIPVVAGLLTAASIQIGPYRDMSPVSFALQDLVIIVALARFALFDLVPIARDLAIDHLDTALVIEDLRHRVVDVNRAGLKMLGISPQEVVGRDTRDVFPYHRELLEQIWNKEDAVFETDARRPWNIGTTLEAHLSTVRDRMGRKIGRLLLLQNITQHKKLEDELRRTRDELAFRLAELEKAQEELLRRERLSTLGQTVATVSHEMRNPLATIRNTLFSLRESIRTGDIARGERSLELAERNIQRCDSIIVELLDFSRQRAPTLEETDMDSWLARVLEELPASDRIVVTRSLGCAARVRIDQERLRRAIVNIHSNAVQAMSADGAARGTLSVESRLSRNRVELSFRDSGTGMSPEVLARAGEPLYSTKSNGVGLGLSVVKAVMEEHGGSIRMESVEGTGTLVVLDFPALR
jgi:PAS domain S-box-containing protein